MQISVIIPTFNRLASLSHCVAALRAQTLPRAQYELIVVDDGSSDGTIAWLAQQADLQTARVAHRGAAAARNAGARLAQAAVLAFTDDDCVVPPDWLCALRAALDGPVLSQQQYRGVEGGDVVGGRMVNAARENIFAETAQAILDALVEELNGDLATAPFGPAQDRLRANMRNGGMLTSNNIAYRREVFQKAGGFDERFIVGAEERDLNYRLWRQGARLCYAPQIVVRHCGEPTLRQFLAQQFAYGRGAHRFYHQSPPPTRLSPSFYWRLITRARQQGTPTRRVAYLACLCLSQCAVLSGYLSAALRHAPSTRRRD